MGRGGWEAACSPWGCKETDMTEQLAHLIACLKLVFSLGVDPFENTKNLENVHIKRTDNKSCVIHNCDKNTEVFKFWRRGG